MDKLRRELFGLIEKGRRFISLSHAHVTLLLFVCHFDVDRCAALGNDFCLPAPKRSTSTVLGANTTLSTFNQTRRHRQRSTPKAHTNTHTRTSAPNTHRLKSNYIIDLFCHSSLVCLPSFFSISLCFILYFVRTRSSFVSVAVPPGSIICLCCRKFHGGVARLLTFQGGNKTISIITLMVAAENNDAELVCRASNPWFPNDTIEDKRIISVACKYLSLSPILPSRYLFISF